MTRPRIELALPSLGASGGTRTVVEWANRFAAEGAAVRLWSVSDGPGRDLLDARVDVTLAPRHVDLAVRAARRTRIQSLHERLALDLAHRAYGRRRRPPMDLRVAAFPPYFAGVADEPAAVPYLQHWEPLWFGSRTAQRTATERCLANPRVIANSTWLKERLAAHGVTAELVFPGYDGTAFPARSAPARRPRWVVTSLGRDEPRWKGLADLRRALEISALEDVELRLFGTVDVSDRAAPWGREVHVGVVGPRQLGELYADSDCVVAPSWHESFPLPPLEAMATGVPVITTDVGTSDYAVDGVNCIVVPARSPEVMANALVRLREQPELAAQLRDAGPDTARPFTWEAGFRSFRAALSTISGGA